MNKKINIFDIGEEDFEEKVIKLSLDHLVLVDFWAPWCGPCKQLTPLLEKIINNSNDKVKLVKINIDQSQQIASQFNIQSIPAVFAFKQGKPVDAFQGVIPEQKIIDFIEKALGQKLKEDFSEFYESIAILMKEQKFENANDSLEVFIDENPHDFTGLSLYLDNMTNQAKYDEAEAFYNTLSTEATNSQQLISSIQKLKIKKDSGKGPSLTSLIKINEEKPDDIKSITKLADKYFAEDMLDEAFLLLLNNYSKNKNIIKNKLLEFFETLGNSNPKTLEYRKKLSSIIFS